jgi:hypothetical protein
MSFFAAGRLSDSPFVDSVWHGQSADDDLTLMCPADGRWNLCLSELHGQIQVSIDGPISRAIPKTHVDGVEWMVIKFKLGVVMPFLSASDILDGQALLPGGAFRSFWLHGATWELPNFENADTFVDRLVKDEVVLWEPVVKAALDDRPPPLSPRTIRHRFLRNIGLTHGHIRQIERARDASTLLQIGVSILDVTDQMGYADQPHLTRALKRFMGYTPVQTMQIKPFM